MNFVICYSKYYNSLYGEREERKFTLECGTSDKEMFDQWVLGLLNTYEDISIKVLKDNKAKEFIEKINQPSKQKNIFQKSMNEQTRVDKELLKNLLKENLTIDIEEDNSYRTRSINVKIKFEDEDICSDSYFVSRNSD